MSGSIWTSKPLSPQLLHEKLDADIVRSNTLGILPDVVVLPVKPACHRADKEAVNLSATCRGSPAFLELEAAVIHAVSEARFPHDIDRKLVYAPRCATTVHDLTLASWLNYGLSRQRTEILLYSSLYVLKTEGPQWVGLRNSQIWPGVDGSRKKNRLLSA